MHRAIRIEGKQDPQSILSTHVNKKGNLVLPRKRSRPSGPQRQDNILCVYGIDSTEAGWVPILFQTWERNSSNSTTSPIFLLLSRTTVTCRS